MSAMPTGDRRQVDGMHGFPTTKRIRLPGGLDRSLARGKVVADPD
jgi:hypothetical protein